ncbi:hypothetical protein CDAR_442771 [Caerostris darwini]|uniref:Uncharacterized protein n=1 Tax=Caerostris darwini TaxID=1538125 RepID=A0AAV4VP38_9ARAC|nr:hypothetical protein CDAR_442771 [Caerostris darwini]
MTVERQTKPNLISPKAWLVFHDVRGRFLPHEGHLHKYFCKHCLSIVAVQTEPIPFRQFTPSTNRLPETISHLIRNIFFRRLHLGIRKDTSSKIKRRRTVYTLVLVTALRPSVITVDSREMPFFAFTIV